MAEAGHLDGVLHGLGAGVEQHGALLVVAGGEPVQLLGDGDVALVGGDHEAGVGEVLHRFLDGTDDGGIGGADAGHGDAGAEVDEGVAVDVVDDAAVGVRHVDGDAGGDAGGDHGTCGVRSVPADLGPGKSAWTLRFCSRR